MQIKKRIEIKLCENLTFSKYVRVFFKEVFSFVNSLNNLLLSNFSPQAIFTVLIADSSSFKLPEIAP